MVGFAGNVQGAEGAALMAQDRLLVCAATLPELRAFGELPDTPALFEAEAHAADGEIAFCLTGVGIPAVFARLVPVVARLQPALLLNIGIAGAYPDSGIAIGDIVIGEAEVYGDIGFELPEPPGFRSLVESPFGEFYRMPIPLAVESYYLQEPVGFRRHTVRGCTVNACTGTEATGRLRAEVTGAAFESMEGAAVAQVGQQAGIPVCEVRAISNIAAAREMRPENIALALARLRDYLRLCKENA
jgi:futalosine hydrolase